MKARLRGTPCEVEVVPYFPEGMFAGFTDVSGTLQPGMVVYKSSDLEFLETPPRLKPDVDWEAFRREAAKAAMNGLLAGRPCRMDREDVAIRATLYADELIKRLNADSEGTHTYLRKTRVMEIIEDAMTNLNPEEVSVLQYVHEEINKL